MILEFMITRMLKKCQGNLIYRFYSVDSKIIFMYKIKLLYYLISLKLSNIHLKNNLKFWKIKIFVCIGCVTNYKEQSR